MTPHATTAAATPRATARQRGFALLVVLWTLAFLALIGTTLAALARQNTQRVGNLLDGAAVQAAAEGALYQAIFALLDTSDRHWSADGTVRLLRSGPYLIELRIDDESGKVNPNIASAELLQALMLQLGARPQVAASLAASIVDWRGVSAEPSPLGAKAPQYIAAGRDYAPPGTAFESLDELGAVLGMTPDLLARLKPHLTLYTSSDPDAATTDPVVAAALGVRSPQPPRPDSGELARVVTVSLAVRGPRGTSFGERVVVRTNSLDDIRRHEILARETIPWVSTNPAR